MKKISGAYTGKPKLDKIPAHAPEDLSQSAVKKQTAGFLEKILKLQGRLYAEGRQKLLIILQGMDGSGKDSCIRHVMGAFNPQSLHITSFKVPEASEAARDFLWRCHRKVPAAGYVAVFNRSYYEELLIGRVEKLREKKEWTKYYGHINAFEEMLHGTGTQILKFYLHISEKEQKKRLEERLNDPEKKWKYDPNDWEARKKWDEYRKAYEQIFEECSSKKLPWHIVPADDKWYRDHFMAKAILKKLEEMDPKFPGLRGEGKK